MGKESILTVQCVNGGFILTSAAQDEEMRTEVFTSQGKLMKALRAAIDAGSLVKKEKGDGDTEPA